MIRRPSDLSNSIYPAAGFRKRLGVGRESGEVLFGV